MSVVKIEQDIKLLENKLKEIDITISDPIGRNEYQKELKKKIKKLKRTKSQIEQQEKEQQELESLKLEFTSNSDESVEIKESESDYNKQIQTANEAGKPISPISSQLVRVNSTFNRPNKKIPWAKIQLFIILGLVLTTAIGITFIINSNNVHKAEEARLKELARQEVMKAQAEVEKAKQERMRAEEEKQEAKKEVAKAKQETIQAKKKVDDLIEKNSYAKATARTSPTKFIKQYYLDINDRNYNLTWQQFAPKRRANPESYNSYISWWNSVENTEIEQIKVLEQNDHKAVVYVELKYLMKTGIIYKERKSKIYLIWNSKYNNWLIEDHQQL